MNKTGKRNLKFRIGIILLITNFIVGYGGVVISGILAAKAENKALWFTIGGVCYACSWIMLLTGTAFAGPEGMKFIKNLWKKIFRR